MLCAAAMRIYDDKFIFNRSLCNKGDLLMVYKSISLMLFVEILALQRSMKLTVEPNYNGN